MTYNLLWCNFNTFICGLTIATSIKMPIIRTRDIPYFLAHTVLNCWVESWLGSLSLCIQDGGCLILWYEDRITIASFKVNWKNNVWGNHADGKYIIFLELGVFALSYYDDTTGKGWWFILFQMINAECDSHRGIKYLFMFILPLWW